MIELLFAVRPAERITDYPIKERVDDDEPR
jgi:hypothetical protein